MVAYYINLIAAFRTLYGYPVLIPDSIIASWTDGEFPKWQAIPTQVFPGYGVAAHVVDFYRRQDEPAPSPRFPGDYYWDYDFFGSTSGDFDLDNFDLWGTVEPSPLVDPDSGLPFSEDNS